MSFMEDPENPQMRSPKPAVTDMWAGVEGVENVAKLTEANFTEVISSNPSVLVMFYAPCKSSAPCVHAFYLSYKILGKNVTGKNVTANNGTNEKIGRNGTLILNFPISKPQY